LQADPSDSTDLAGASVVRMPARITPILDFVCQEFRLKKAAVKPFSPPGKILSIPTLYQSIRDVKSQPRSAAI
jgi:hypothetical protein